SMLREAQWGVENHKKAMNDSKGDGGSLKAAIRTAHAERLRLEHGLKVEPVTYDVPIAQDPNSALTYHDPSGQPLAPKLPVPPIDGPDVTLRNLREVQAKAAAAPGAQAIGAPP